MQYKWLTNRRKPEHKNQGHARIAFFDNQIRLTVHFGGRTIQREAIMNETNEQPKEIRIYRPVLIWSDGDYLTVEDYCGNIYRFDDYFSNEI